MKYSLAIYSPPGSHADLAREFCEQVIAQGHSIYRVFFFSDGVLNCALTPHNRAWREFINANHVDAVVCIASAHKRGVYDAASAKRLDNAPHNLADEFAIGGLGQLIDAQVQSDRVITFGGEEKI